MLKRSHSSIFFSIVFFHNNLTLFCANKTQHITIGQNYRLKVLFLLLPNRVYSQTTKKKYLHKAVNICIYSKVTKQDTKKTNICGKIHEQLKKKITEAYLRARYKMIWWNSFSSHVQRLMMMKNSKKWSLLNW